MRVLLLLLLLPVITRSQTTVIVKRSNKEIYVAADSRYGQQSLRWNGVSTSTPLVGCKIFQIGKFNFSMTNIFPHENYHDATESFKNSEDYSSGIDIYVRLYGSTVQRKIDTLRLLHPEQYKRFKELYKEGISNLILFGYDGDTSFVKIISIKAIMDEHTVAVGFRIITPHRDSVVAIGETGAIYTMLNDPKYWRHRKVKEGLNNLISIQSKATPDKVAPPVDMVRVTKNKVVWVQRKKICQPTPESIKLYPLEQP